jgi:hypothetical protein
MVAQAVIFLVTALAVGAQEYAGSAACARCHAEIAGRYAKSGMGRSMAPARLLPEAKVEAPRLGRTFEVTHKDGKLWQRESGAGFTNEHELVYAIGSGANGISFAVKRGDHLFQAPLSWYARTGAWELSPGYEHADYGFNRPLAAACLACHAGRPRPVALSSGRYLDPPFEETAIGCENCHGPGRKHASSGRRADIVNPARLPRARAEEICMNCHQGGDARVYLPGKQETDFRPGQRLWDVVAIFQAGRTGDTDLLQHHEAMRESACFQKSATLSCHTCHNPHAAKTDQDATCAGCHKTLAASHPPERRDCAKCHMPKREIGFIAHSALTNHRISREAPAARGAGLRQINDGAAPTALTLLQAYGQALAKFPGLAGEFQAALAAAPAGEPIVLATRGRQALREGRFAEAVPLLRGALEKGYRVAATYEDLADALGRAGQLEASLEIIGQGLAAAPFSQTLHKSLALRHIQRKDYPAAKAALERYVALFPEDDFIRRLLRQVSGTP